ncbi:hypothetical protein [Candidatus Tisiphia endosymbiont of Parasteatoda lunata]|uniref:hypothetical protein n=1 Tax=Candidatus Tisiphia endosymbiont of Parasteatoda lunata TaxID=3066275 RepID=UPI00313BBB45
MTILLSITISSISYPELTCIVQGMTSMGEIVGAGLYLTETTKPPIQYVSVTLVGLSATLGSMGALGIASLVTSYGFNWRLAFWIGAILALIGFAAKTTLRETPEFANAKLILKKKYEKANIDIKALYNDPVVNKKTIIAFLLLECSTPVCFYFIYLHCGTILKTDFGYTSTEVIHHNFIVSVLEFLILSILSYVSYRVYPLLTAKIILIIYSIVILFKYCHTSAAPIFYKSFPVFKRFTCVSVIFSVSRALMYVITSFGFIYIIDYFGNWGILIIMIPTIIAFAYGLLHFEKLEKDSRSYPQKRTNSVTSI